MNSTEKTLLERGLDSFKAREICKRNYTLETLAACNTEEKKTLGLTEKEIHLVFESGRPKIPDDIINELLYKSRNTCCVCRNPSKSIVIHHMVVWHKTKDNSEENLVVLCVDDHNKAHTTKELSKNLTADIIKSLKTKWEKCVKKQDEDLINCQIFKELNVIPIQLSELKERWFNFLKNLGWKIELVSNLTDKVKYDFKVFGIRELVFRVYEIDEISDLLNKDILIHEFDEESFFDSLIILGKKPFLSNNGYYDGEMNIQIGWVYSHGAEDWDHVMLKHNYDISNSIFCVENFLYPETSYKDFLVESDMPEITKYWDEGI